MPGTSKISDYVGLRVPKPLVADMKRLCGEKKIALSKFIIEALYKAVDSDNAQFNKEVKESRQWFP
jgi:hypothetical protein